MALTEEQKLEVRKRRDALISEGRSPADATRIAFDELAGAGAFEKRIIEKRAPAPVDPAITSYKAAEASLVKAEQDFVRARRDELKRKGYSDAEASSIAQDEYNRTFNVPTSTAYGTFEEKKAEEDLFIPEAITRPIVDLVPEPYAKAFMPQRIQTTYPGIKTQEEKKKEVTSLPFATSDVPSGLGPNWSKIKASLKDSGVSESELDAYVDGIRKAYDIKLEEEIKASTPDRINKLPKDVEDLMRRRSPEEIAKIALQKALQEIEGIDSVGTISDPAAARSKELKSQSGDILEQLGAAFGKQVRPGEISIPDYTDAQIEFLKVLGEREKEKQIQKAIASAPKKEVYRLKDGSVIDKAEYDRRSSTGDDLSIIGAKKEEVARTEAEIRKDFETELPWYLDPAKKKRYLADPEKYVQKGVLSEEAITGATKETTTGALLRGALSITNAVAGAFAPILFEGFGETGEAIAAEKRRRRPELYKDSPILYNIAENKGFFGEGQEVADILGLEGAEKAAYLGGTFAADILDPSLDFVAAVGKGAKVSHQAAKAGEALGKLASVSMTTQASIAFKTGLNDLLDNAFFGVIKPRTNVSNARDVATLQLTSSLSDATKASDALKANPGQSAADVAKTLGDSNYSKLFKEAAKKGGSLEDVVSSLKASDELITKADKLSESLDDFIRTGKVKDLGATRQKELLRQLGALAATDSTAAAAIRKVDAEKLLEGETRLGEYLKALTPDQISRIKKGLVYDLASVEVAKVTKGATTLDNMVALTKNTFVDKSLLPKIMEKAKASEIASISKTLEGSKISYKTTGRGVEQVFSVPENTSRSLETIANELQNFKKLDDATLSNIKSTLSKGYISTSDFRAMVDGNLDLLAEATAIGTAGVTRARDVARMDLPKQLDALVPVESRSFTRGWLKDFLLKATGKYKASPSKLSVGGQRLLEEATAKVSNLDTKLRNEVTSLLEKGSPLREAYGIPADANLSRRDALAHAIVGPVESVERPNILSTLEFALANLFYSKEQRFDIFNLFHGVDISRETAPLTAAGRDALRERIVSSAKIIESNPTRFWEQLLLLRDEYRDILSTALRDSNFRDEFFRLDPTTIVDVTASPGLKGRLPDEVAVGSYYKAEADRINKALVSDLVNKEVGKAGIKLSEYMDNKYLADADEALRGYGTSFDEFSRELVKVRLQGLLDDASYSEKIFTDEEIAKIFLKKKAAETAFEEAKSLKISDIKGTVAEKISDLEEKLAKALGTKEEDLRILESTAASYQRSRNTSELSKINPKIEALKKEITKIKSPFEEKIAKIKEREAKKVSAKEGKALPGPRSKGFERAAEAGMERMVETVANDLKIKSIVDDMIGPADDIANGIIRQNDLRASASLDKLAGILKDIKSGDEAAKLRLLYGDDVASQIVESFEKGFKDLSKDLQKSLVNAYEGKNPLVSFWDFLGNAIEYTNNFRYFLLLNIRPRFHAANMITAADIYFQTTGKLPNYPDVLKGLALGFTAQKTPGKIILKDKSGRLYTAAEVYDALSTMGGKSVYTLSYPNLSNKEALNLTSDEFNRFKAWWASFNRIPNTEDMAFRFSALSDALRSGRSFDEGLALARKSMFDAADITDFEKSLSINRLLMFYGFMRNNFVNFAKNMSSPEGIRRIIKFLKTERNVESSLTTEEEREYAPGYIQTKTILDKIAGKDKDLYLTSPSWATKDAVKLFGEILKGNLFEVLGGMVNPTYKDLLGVEDSFDRKLTKIPAEHVLLASLLDPLNVVGKSNLFSFISGGDVVPRRGKPEEGAVDGWIYPLTTPSQQTRYKAFNDLINAFGLTSPLTEWTKIISGQGSAAGVAYDRLPAGAGLGNKIAFATSVLNPTLSVPTWKVDYYNKLSKIAEIKAATADIEKEESKGMAAEAKPLTPEMAETIADIQGAAAERIEATDPYARLLQLKKELNRYIIRSEYASGKYSSEEDLEKRYIEPRVEEIEKLEAEIEKMEGLKAGARTPPAADKKEPSAPSRQPSTRQARSDREPVERPARQPIERTPRERTPRDR